jgi:hypothetical protein
MYVRGDVRRGGVATWLMRGSALGVWSGVYAGLQGMTRTMHFGSEPWMRCACCSRDLQGMRSSKGCRTLGLVARLV